MSVDLQLNDGNVNLAAGAADIAVRIGALADTSLIGTRLGSMRTVVVASPALLDRHREVQHPDDLKFLPSIKLTLPTQPTPQSHRKPNLLA
ncbi:LysR substrate-binding domain-containing protein [Agrobacterium sp. FDAARGOS_525]|uniref:LysR substrate-binding domain-containing protein n=1 Tax=Agrobacterium sp. FDAARGOS_525 TaxID=2420311 RepID=UPI003365A5F8